MLGRGDHDMGFTAVRNIISDFQLMLGQQNPCDVVYTRGCTTQFAGNRLFSVYL